MLRTAALVVCLALAQGDSARAAERHAAPSSPGVVCQPLEKFKAAFPAQTKYKAATIGQFHVLEGVYIGSPKTPEGLPPGDGALIVRPPVEHGQPDLSLIVWTQHAGKDICGAARTNLMVPSAALAVINSVETGNGEAIDPEDSSEDRSL